jgi:hypothetical protein
MAKNYYNFIAVATERPSQEIDMFHLHCIHYMLVFTLTKRKLNFDSEFAHSNQYLMSLNKELGMIEHYSR